MKLLRRGITIISMGFLLCFCPYLKTEPAWAAGSYQVNGTSITVSAGTNEDVYSVMKSATEYARDHNSSSTIYTIKLVAGDYKLSNAIRVYGNVKLDLTGVTLHYVGDTNNMLMLGNASTNSNPVYASEYGLRHNITVIGGIWIGNDQNTSSLVRMSHSSNITFDGCVFSGGGCSHQMEVAAIDGLTVKNCTFKDMAGNDSSGKKEALQLDVVCSSYAYKNTILDGTPMKNVIITGCTFQNVPRGVGTHSMLLGSYHTNIEITDNVFENVDGECIVALNYKNCTIRGNKMKNSGAGIIFQFFKPNVSAVYNTIQDGTVTYSGSVEHDSDSIISNNEISINTSKYASEYVGIRIYGYNLEQDTVASGNGSSDLIPKGDYYVSNVRIVGNTIKTCGNGIHLSDARDCTVIGNKITNIDENSWDDGILVDEDSKNISIQKNEVKNSTRYGIRLENYSSATSIYGNTVSASIYYGISVNNNSKVTGNIEKNTIKNCDDNGICIQEYSRVKNISNNTITSCDWHGITLYDGCEVTGNITGNKISKCGQNGIFLNLESSAKSVTKNTLTQNGKYAIALYDGSQVTNSISSNTISKNKFHAIQLNLDCTADKINSNKITNTKGKGILIEDGSTVWSSISSNTINTASQEGIYVNSSRNSLTIKGNSIKKCSRSSIVINTVSKMKITISKNSIITTKGKKPLLVIKGKVKSDIKDK